MNLYFIPGLGADKRVFQFLDHSAYQPVYLDWIEPYPKEPLAAYALRLAEAIPEENAVVAGVSFGGMLATEMAKARPGFTCILISSAKTAAEIPGYLRMWKYLPIYRWFPQKTTGYLLNRADRLFSTEGDAQRKVQKQIIADTDIPFCKWAIDAIVHWNNSTIPSNIIHIHGTADKLLPYRYVQPHHTIPKGKHLMVMDYPAEIGALLQSIIHTVSPAGVNI